MYEPLVIALCVLWLLAAPLVGPFAASIVRGDS